VSNGYLEALDMVIEKDKKKRERDFRCWNYDVVWLDQY